MFQPLKDILADPKAFLVNVMMAQQQERGETPNRAKYEARYAEHAKARLVFDQLVTKERTHGRRSH